MGVTPTVTSKRGDILGQLQLLFNGAIGTTTPIKISDHLVWFVKESDFDSFFTRSDTKEINGWEFERGDLEEAEDDERGRWFHVLEWNLYGYYGVKERTFTSKKISDQLEQVTDNFRFNATVFGAVEIPERAPRNVIHATGPMHMDKGERNVWMVHVRFKTTHYENLAA